MIVVTGAAGFIASCLIEALNIRFPHQEIVAVDRFDGRSRLSNIKQKKIREYVDRKVFIHWMERHHKNIDIVFHLGARTDTLEANRTIFDKLNLEYSKAVWFKCANYDIPLIYASSAATYGKAEHGFSDDHQNLEKLSPMNAYAESKHQFDLWAVQQKDQPPFWYGLKFFNVFGPNEYHKGSMASMIYQGFQQIRDSGHIKLFKSYIQGYADGAQSRDFIYVKDITSISLALFENADERSGIYNVGTGISSSFIKMADHIFNAVGKVVDIRFIEMPVDIQNKYQYHTQADLSKLRTLDIAITNHSFRDAISDYVQNYLLTNRYY